MLQAEAAELRAKVEKRNREVRELNQMLKAWEAMRHSKDRQIEQLVERCRKFEEEAAEKSRAVDAMRRRLGRDRPGSVTGTPTSMTRSVGRSGSGVGSVSFGGNHSRGGWLDDGEGDGRGGGGAAGERSTTRGAAGDDSFFSFGGGNAAAGTARGGGGSSAVDKENPAGVHVGSPRASPKRRGGVADALGDEIVRRRRRERRRRAGVCGKVGTRGGGRGGVARAKRAQVAHPAAQQVGGRQERGARRGDWATRGDETAHEPRVLARW